MKNPYDAAEHPEQHASFEVGVEVGRVHGVWIKERSAKLAVLQEEAEEKRKARDPEYEEPTVPDRVGAWQKGYQGALQEEVRS